MLVLELNSVAKAFTVSGFDMTVMCAIVLGRDAEVPAVD